MTEYSRVGKIAACNMTACLRITDFLLKIMGCLLAFGKNVFQKQMHTFLKCTRQIGFEDKTCFLKSP